MFGGIFLAIVLVIWMITRLPPRRHVNYTLSLSLFCGMVTLCFCLCTLGVYFGYYPRYFDNLVNAYDEYGFATCFAFTFGDMGVAKPSEYSTETVTDIIEEIDDAAPQPTAEPEARVFGEDDDLAHPNVIYVQLESLFDVNTILGSSLRVGSDAELQPPEPRIPQRRTVRALHRRRPGEHGIRGALGHEPRFLRRGRIPLQHHPARDDVRDDRLQPHAAGLFHHRHAQPQRHLLQPQRGLRAAGLRALRLAGVYALRDLHAHRLGRGHRAGRRGAQGARGHRRARLHHGHHRRIPRQVRRQLRLSGGRPRSSNRCRSRSTRRAFPITCA